MSSGNVFVVIGAKGGTGAEMVKRLAEKSPDEVSEIRCVVRNPDSVRADLLPADKRVKILKGDATNYDSLLEHFSDAEAVFFAAQGKGYYTIRDVDRDSMRILGEAALEKGVKRVVLLSSMLVDPRNRFRPIRILLNSPFITGCAGFVHSKGMMDLKYEGEKILRKTGQAYTIIRPGHLYDGPLASAKIVAGQTNGAFAGGMKSTRADVAAFCVMAATAANAKNATIEIASDPKSRGAKVIHPSILDSIKPDKS
mmetsp:Transcript_11835/g.13763  ORF Transcript_11835/g.13763 Transcript_11835/m.13763 type:complete len:254 (+) Transcript_11835:126-887(+)